MKAIRIHSYGPADKLVYEEIPDPTPGPGEVVVAVEAIGVNPADCKFRNGSLATVNPKPLPFIPGMDIAGCVHSVGAGVAGLKIGDRVMAMLYMMGNGGYAERVAVPAEWCAAMPAALGAVMAATLPTPATTAIEWIEDDLRVTDNVRVLITGATGAVGLIACYVAKQRGAHVTAAVKKARASQVKFADDVLVLDDGSVVRQGWYDCIADTVGGTTAAALLRGLKSGGALSTVATDPVQNTDGLDVTIRFFGNHADAPKLTRIATAVASESLLIPAPQIMKLREAHKAHALLERGGAGKIVLTPR